MEINYERLKNIELFIDFTKEELYRFFESVNYREKSFPEGADIYVPGNTISETAIILSGVVHVMQLSYQGSESIVSRYKAGQMLGNAFNITREINPFSYMRCATDVSVLFVDLLDIFQNDQNEIYYQKFAINAASFLARSNINMTKKINIYTRKTLREKLLAFFYQLAEQENSRCFRLQFTREQLAQYVCSERSSVCRELGKMQDEKIIRIDKDRFELLCWNRESF